MKAYLAAVQAQQKEYLAYLQAQMSAAQQQQGGAKGGARGGPPARGKPGGKASPGPPGTLQPPPGVAPPYPVPAAGASRRGNAVARWRRRRRLPAEVRLARWREAWWPCPAAVAAGLPANYGPPPGYSSGQ